MLEQVLEHIHNWFQLDVVTGTYTIEDGDIELPFLQDGQYFRIVGSIFNDGLHRYGPDMKALHDETFNGAIWALAIPKSVIDLAREISAWQQKYGERATGPYSSESLAGQYSYTKEIDSTTGGPVTWESVFRSRLNQWRKI